MGKISAEVQRHMKGELAPLTDEAGHCKLCGVEIVETHLMHDPDGSGPPLEFCSAKCLYDAEHMLDELDAVQLEQLAAAIAKAEPGHE